MTTWSSKGARMKTKFEFDEDSDIASFLDDHYNWVCPECGISYPQESMTNGECVECGTRLENE